MPTKAKAPANVPASSGLAVERIALMVKLIRGEKVMLDSDLAELYGVEVKVLNQAVQRNTERFPQDFMFQLTEEDRDSLRSQIVTLKLRFHVIFDAIKKLVASPSPRRRELGFHTISSSSAGKKP